MTEQNILYNDLFITFNDVYQINCSYNYNIVINNTFNKLLIL